MNESDRPVTAGELREQLAAYPTRADLREVLAAYPTRADLREVLAAYPTRDEFRAELKAALQPYATKADLMAVRDELRTHFEAAVERFRDEFAWLHEWAQANHKGLARRVDALEQGHGGRLLALETRVTALEIGRSRR